MNDAYQEAKRAIKRLLHAKDNARISIPIFIPV